jgi:ferritin-like metal-binding protein YciE
MADENLRQLVAQGLAALRAGSQVAQDATQEIQDSASHPDLKQALEQGTQTSQEWNQRIDRALQEVGGPAGPEDNPILQAHFEVSRRIRGEAPDAQSRDLGIIAAGQLALHYWIASFGTLASYAKQLGMQDTARDLHQCVEEAKQADDQHTALAERMLGQPA